MRTVFVNPAFSAKGRFTIKKRKKGKKNPYILGNPRRRRRSNPGFDDIGGIARETAMLVAGSAGGAVLNRIGINRITNFYVRNGARVLGAAFLTTVNVNPIVTIAAAGAMLAPIVPEVEMQLAATGIKKNPDELAAELADLLEADLLSDGDLESDDLEADEIEGF